MGTSPGLAANMDSIHSYFPGRAVIQEDDKLQHLIIISANTTWNKAYEIKGYRKMESVVKVLSLLLSIVLRG